jgi:PAS domain-containing protein
MQRMNEGVLTVDPNGLILFANDRSSELTGFPTDDLIDRHVATLFAGKAPGAHDLLTQPRSSGIGLSELVTSILAPFRSREERIKASGCQIALPADAIVSLSMTLHELTTNAA